MANPRQRRKSRSSQNILSKSKRSQKNEKKVKVRGHPSVVAAWDNKKTVRQNYERLGLLSTPNPKAIGLEPLPVTPHVYKTRSQLDSQPSQEKPLSSDKIPKGFARVVRDADGNITDVIYASDDEEDDLMEKPAETAWGKPFADEEETAAQDVVVELEPQEGIHRVEGIPFAEELPDGKGGLRVVKLPPKPKTELVKELEEFAANERPSQKRHTSAIESEWLSSLAKAHNGNIEKMARDVRLNPLQRTPGQLKKQIKVAGGIEHLLRDT